MLDIGEHDLRERAAEYGLEDELDALLRYLDTRGAAESTRLPEWSVFQELAADYGVTFPQPDLSGRRVRGTPRRGASPRQNPFVQIQRVFEYEHDIRAVGGAGCAQICCLW
jgi:hypothetical protein